MKRTGRFVSVFALTLALLFSNVVGGSYTVDATAKQKLHLNKTKLTLASGEKKTVKLIGLSKGQKATWSISGKKVLKKVKTARASIKVKALKAGKAKIKAKVSKKTYTCQVVVEDENVHTYSDHDEFASAVADMIISHPVKSSAAIAASDRFFTGRLIVQGKDKTISFSEYNPVAVMKNDENTSILQFETSGAAKEAFQKIANRTDIEWAEPDEYIGSSETGVGVAGYGYSDHLSWGVERMGADVYASQTSKNNITVAVVDTGVSAHSFLSGRIVSGYDYIENDTDPSDLNSHGTHVAGTIVDCTPGLNVKIMPVRCLDAGGSGTSTTIGLGIRYAADHGAKVINLSLGGGHTNYEDSCIQYAMNKGVTVVAAAGNEYSNTSSFCPAHIGSIIVVAALDEHENRASFSNYGNSVDVAAPGVDIVSCIPGGSYASYDGTSMATPHIVALAAMIKLNYPDSSPAQVEAAVKSCCRDLGSSGWDAYYGYGIPDLRYNTVTPPENTPTPTVKPTATPTIKPTTAPTVKPTATPTIKPTVKPTIKPIVTPTPTPGGGVGEDGGFEYRVLSNGTALITGYTGYGGDLSIPMMLDGYSVSGIGDGAFRGNSSIRSVKITGSGWIGESAFEGCSNLTKIRIEGMITGVASRAFAGNRSLMEITVTGMFFQVQPDIFSDCGSLTGAYVSGMIDMSVQTAFKNCPSLTNIQITGLVGW